LPLVHGFALAEPRLSVMHPTAAVGWALPTIGETIFEKSP
jgi:hypothetical protein